MEQAGVGCVITLGGDGTNRAVATGSKSIPMVAISTGTNNVFPAMIEGTLAGLAAGLVARGDLPVEDVSQRSKTVRVYVDGEYRDMALVDVALSRERYVATRAIWDMSTIFEVFLTRAEPGSIGLSSVGARLMPLSLADEGGLYYPHRHGKRHTGRECDLGACAYCSGDHFPVSPSRTGARLRRESGCP